MIKYIVIALGLLLIGSVADVPAMFLATHGLLSLPFVIIVGFLADILPDFFWYWLGGKIGIKRFEKLPVFKQKPEHLEAVGRALDKHGAYILFASKFVYLLGIPAQITAGAHHFPLKRAIIANALGSAGWLVLLYVLAHIFTTVKVINEHLQNFQLDFTIFVILALIMYGLLSRFLGRFIESD